MKRIAALVSNSVGLACLNHMIEVQDNLSLKICGVITDRGKSCEDEISELARKHGIPIRSKLDELVNFGDFDILISVQCYQILKQSHINLASDIAINLHMAPLPEYRGCNAFSFALINEESTFGTTIHQMEELVDAGAIIAETRFEIPYNCNVQDLHDLTVNESIVLFKKEIGNIVQGNFELISQASLVAERGSKTYYRKDIESVKAIDLSWPRAKIERHIRATSMPEFDPPHFTLNGQKTDKRPEYIDQ